MRERGARNGLAAGRRWPADQADGAEELGIGRRALIAGLVANVPEAGTYGLPLKVRKKFRNKLGQAEKFVLVVKLTCAGSGTKATKRARVRVTR